MKKRNRKDYFCVDFCFSGEEKKIEVFCETLKSGCLNFNDINKVLELHNIKCFFDKYSYVNGWSETKFLLYKNLIEDNYKEIELNAFSALDETNVVEAFDQCNALFYDLFFQFFYKFNVYERISNKNFINVMNGMRMSPNKILENKKFVSKFDAEIASMFKNPDFGGARFLVEYYLSNNTKCKYYLPKSLSTSDKYKIVEDYIAGDIVNAHILDLIMNCKSSNPKEFNVDDRLRIKAKRRYKKYWEDNSENAIRIDTGINVEFSIDNPISSRTFDRGVLVAKYNSNWIDENLDYPTLLNNFIYLFEYTNSKMICQLTTATLKTSAIESLFLTKGNAMYVTGRPFELMNSLANAQMDCYYNILSKQYNIYIEKIVKWFFEEYLLEEFQADGFVCTMPEVTDSLLSKYDRFASVMDGVKKQFLLFVEDGYVDRELFELSSNPVRYSDIPSLVKNKYGYAESEDIQREINNLFSDQSMLSFTEKTQGKYETFCELVVSENITYEDIPEYNVEEIDWLLKRGTIVFVDNNIKLNVPRFRVLGELYHDGVICLSYYRKSEVVNDLISKGDIVVESKLLTRAESQYFDYMLNKSVFSNGLDLRNKYIHDTASLNEKIQHSDYMKLIKMMIILVIKINDDFCLRDLND